MKICKILILALVFAAVPEGSLYSGNVPSTFRKVLLKDVAENIKDYEKKTITLRLKLKYVDRVFEKRTFDEGRNEKMVLVEKIFFYDKKNYVIEFDISAEEVRKKLERSLATLRSGMEYYVTFKVVEMGKREKVIGELESFVPVILMELP
ncbi:MAG: hypothetical protein GY754_13640 [bacterium]|nr:hypothetical protein [bacterium]